VYIETVSLDGTVFYENNKNQLMSTPQSHKEQKEEKSQKDKKQPLGQPDPETLHTTDPEEHMKGPISSIMQKIKEGAEENDEQDRKETEEGKR
jgi:hypothetical protein